MAQNNNNKKPGGKRGGNWRGVVSLVCWALVLTIIVSYASSYMSSAGHQSSSVEIEYSDFVEMVEDKQVEKVIFDSAESILTVVPKDGYVYTSEDGVAYTNGTDEDGNDIFTYTDKNGREQTAALRSP